MKKAEKVAKPSKEEFLRLYHECGHNVPILSNRLNISRVRCYSWCRQLPEIRDEVSLEARRLREWRMWKGGMTLEEIARKEGITRSVVAEHVMVHRRWDYDDANYMDECTRIPSHKRDRDRSMSVQGRWRWED